ncbi:Ribosomal protein [Plasmodium coatneyi]|uniref:Large ribosomal subunit protein bL21m n=1 Tax=Plasmodium coatneyi TaxID=208452 RepID=A0A1B1E667_9APIC|nr:Ribosomal protein [Plasmodium coatneyi]ANQ10516.1 Ribosomal protein [Plasmodium coatneyi]
MMGKHRKRKINPPLYPVHPNEEKKKNLNNFITYKDLKIRWRNTSKNYRKKVTIARKWKNLHCILPMNKQSCIFILHKNLPYTRFKGRDASMGGPIKQISDNPEGGFPNGVATPPCAKTNGTLSRRRKAKYRNSTRVCHAEGEAGKPNDEPHQLSHPDEVDPIPQGDFTTQLNYHEVPPSDVQHLLRKGTEDLFCIFKSNFISEHKVTIGDIVQTEKLHRRKAGDVIYFGTVLLVGSKDFTIIGKPTVPYCRVKATIEQITLSKEILSFRYKKVRRSSRFLRIKHWITILRIDDIIIDTKQPVKDERKKPLQILDLWANRWLYEKELNFIKFNESGTAPLAEQIYDLVEHQPNTLHRRGLTDCYRFYPDPRVPHTSPYGVAHVAHTMGVKFEFFRFFKLNYYAFYVKKEKLYTFLHTTTAYSLVGVTIYLGYSFFHMWNDAVHYSYKHYMRKEKQRKELYDKIRIARENGLIPKSQVDLSR